MSERARLVAYLEHLEATANGRPARRRNDTAASPNRQTSPTRRLARVLSLIDLRKGLALLDENSRIVACPDTPRRQEGTLYVEAVR